MPAAPRPASHPPTRPRLGSALLLALGLAQGAPALAANQSYALDPVHTRVGFQVSHAGFSNPLGSFSGASGRLEFDPENWAGAQLDVRIPIATLNLGDAKWQQKILDRTFFDAGKFPDAHFVSRKVDANGAQGARVTGDLTLHGVTAPVSLQVTFNALKRHPLTRKRTVGFSATGTLSRKAFGIDAWQHLVGDEVRLIIELEATRTREDTTPAEPAEPAASEPQPQPPPVEADGAEVPPAEADGAEAPAPTEPPDAAA